MGFSFYVVKLLHFGANSFITFPQALREQAIAPKRRQLSRLGKVFATGH
jgi:hypothetical protein